MTTQESTALTFEDVYLKVIPVQAALAFSRYRHVRTISYDDVYNQMFVWYLEHEDRIRRWLANDPQQTTRVKRSLYDAARRYCEKEAAELYGYKADDIHWYTPTSVAAIMPLVLDSTFTEETGKVAELITAVVDVRRVLTRELRLYFLSADEEFAVDWDDRIAEVINLLGGRSPYQRRRIVSNATAQVQARTGYEGS